MRKVQGVMTSNVRMMIEKLHILGGSCSIASNERVNKLYALSADTAVESLMVADLERCFPDFRKQTKFRQCLNKRKKVLSK